MKVTILGCGASGGVPLSTGEWGSCDPTNPKNRRRRVSIAVQDQDSTLIVDTSPDFRAQVLDAGITKIDAVLYTHDHADHSHGIDDLRPFFYGHGKSIDVYTDEGALRTLKERFAYIFRARPSTPDLYKPFLKPHVINGPFKVGTIPVTSFWQDHGYSRTLGYRFDKVAYSTDVLNLDEAAFKALQGVKVWIVDCLAYEVKPTHSHLAKTLAWIERVNPEKAYLTHMNHTLDYEEVKKRLPSNVEPSYDGLVIEV
ncbi:Phosphoribosyl 1,2-cyclic phosphodiesterase [Candidatus Bealeia paramacronuclearis]|uniref:Phosphoribosyl 1,2-cyclic phosphodiesterase n=1 Tax=Candidatus Bealeia paramacronuclearis TaxID=1921001 RepID=A0ABZ2C6A4_9PROT|nr:Phosphoribosyl 1,2-cyclic phosphodiesterase [Candidatus Bealeia paramacronuclearis]